MAKKSSTKSLMIVAILIAVIGIGGAVFALTMDRGNDTTSRDDSEQTAEEMGMTEEEHANMDKNNDATQNTDEYQITFTDDGFQKPEVTVPKGATVIVTNLSSMDMQFSSDDHPTHKENPELNLRVLSTNESANFTAPDKAGEYGFHDHINDQYTGVLIVE